MNDRFRRATEIIFRRFIVIYQEEKEKYRRASVVLHCEKRQDADGHHDASLRSWHTAKAVCSDHPHFFSH
jgi:hypothetical protein